MDKISKQENVHLTEYETIADYNQHKFFGGGWGILQNTHIHPNNHGN